MGVSVLVCQHGGTFHDATHSPLVAGRRGHRCRLTGSGRGSDGPVEIPGDPGGDRETGLGPVYLFLRCKPCAGQVASAMQRKGRTGAEESGPRAHQRRDDAGHGRGQRAEFTIPIPNPTAAAVDALLEGGLRIRLFSGAALVAQGRSTSQPAGWSGPGTDSRWRVRKRSVLSKRRTATCRAVTSGSSRNQAAGRSLTHLRQFFPVDLPRDPGREHRVQRQSFHRWLRPVRPPDRNQGLGQKDSGK